MFNEIKINEEELKRIARRDVTTAEQYIVFRIKELEDSNVELIGELTGANRRCEYLEHDLNKCHEDNKGLEIELDRARAEKSNLLDFKNGLRNLTKLFGWKGKNVLDKKKGETRYFLIDKNKKSIEVDFDIWFAVNVINQEK